MSESITVLNHYDQVPAIDIAGRYWKSIMHHGARSYVENADLSIKALSIAGKIIPLVINQGKGHFSDICSPYAHYLMYTAEEFRRRHSRPVGLALPMLVFPLGVLLRCTSIDRVVFINNWLFTTNPSPSLSRTQIHAATKLLLHEYPDFAIVMRSLNPLMDQSLLKSLIENGYRLVRSRRVYIFDCVSQHYLRHRNTQSDLKLLKNSPYCVIDCHKAPDKQIVRMAELYRDLYLTKYSRLNPHFTSDFFRLTLKENIFAYRALEKDGRIDGFITYFVQDDRVIGTVAGYDRGLSPRVGLYRMLIAIILSEAARRNLKLHLSGGAGHFKLLRGAVPVEEYDAVYDRHLPRHRRLAWATLMMAGRLAERERPMAV